MKYLKPAAYVLISAMAYSCANNKSDEQLTASNLDPRNFVTEVDGKPVALYTLVNGSGMEACITNFGGRIVSLMVPDRDGVMRDVVLGFDNIADYLPENNDSNFGAIIGRYGNRINQGRMVVDGDTVQLPQNNYGHCLHGGPTGWHYKVFDAEQPNDTTLVLTLVSPDGDNNFPG
ncbi:MAG: galactose-1-epimerase, partial [Muribaculaceae bacterium]|nr:galactose-1-epimerase [Muribaculaceae bacterium]